MSLAMIAKMTLEPGIFFEVVHRTGGPSRKPARMGANQNFLQPEAAPAAANLNSSSLTPTRSGSTCGKADPKQRCLGWSNSCLPRRRPRKVRDGRNLGMLKRHNGPAPAQSAALIHGLDKMFVRLERILLRIFARSFSLVLRALCTQAHSVRGRSFSLTHRSEGPAAQGDSPVMVTCSAQEFRSALTMDVQMVIPAEGPL